jgi:hypothetical protein
VKRILATKLSLHDIGDVEAYCAAVLDRSLRRQRGFLKPDDREDALSHLIATAWELSRRWEPARCPSFADYLSEILPRRLVDWQRRRYGDSRYRRDVVREIVDADNRELLDLADELDVGDDIADRLSPLPVHPSALTPRAQWILREIVAPLVERGDSYEEIATRYGYSRKWTERLLAELRAELSDLQEAA